MPRYTRICLLISAILIVASLSAQQSEIVVPQLATPSSVTKKIDALKVRVPLNALRRGPYGWDYSGKWEVDFQVMPWLSYQQNEYVIYTRGFEAGGSRTTTYFGPDRFYELTQTRTAEYSVGKRPGISLVNATVARQFGSGFRLGLGILVYRNLIPRRLSMEEVTNLADAGELIHSWRWGYRESFMYGQLGYTFRQRRRLRPSVGLTVTSFTGYSSRAGSKTLYDGGTGEVIDRSDGSPLQFEVSDLIFALARVGMQYQISRSFSIGFDAALLLGQESYYEVPFVTFGGRYRFSRQR